MSAISTPSRTAPCSTPASESFAFAMATSRTATLPTSSRPSSHRAATSKTKSGTPSAKNDSRALSAAAAMGGTPRSQSRNRNRPHRLRRDRIARSGELSARRWNAAAAERLSRSAPFSLPQSRDRRLSSGPLAPTRRAAHRIRSALRLGRDHSPSALFAARIAVVYSPPGAESKTKISAGIGLYYEHTQLEYLTRALAGVRYDTYYAADGITPTGPPLETTFQANDGSLPESRALNWSLGVEQKFPGHLSPPQLSPEAHLRRIRLRKPDRPSLPVRNLSAHQRPTGSLQLLRDRSPPHLRQRLHALRLLHPLLSDNQRRTRLHPHRLVARAAAERTAPLGHPQPPHLLGMAPLPLPKLKKNWDFVYTMNWHTGFPFTSINAEPRGRRRGRLHAIPRLHLLQPRPRMALSPPRRILRPPRRRRKRHRPRQSSRRQQRRRLPRLRNLHRALWPVLHRTPAPHRLKIEPYEVPF